MSQTRLFISGVAGFLGSHMADWGLQQGHQVLGCDNFLTGKKENIPKGVDFYEYNLLDLEKNKKYLKDVDIVFHAAAYPYDHFSLFSPYKITENTFSTTASLLSGAIHNNAKRFILCSSMARYGSSQSPFIESVTPKPLTPYGVAKVASENLLKSLAEAHGFEYVICVPHNIFGPKQIYNDPYRNAVSIIINKMLQDKSPLIYGDGEQKRSFSPVKDVVGVFEDLLFSKKVQGEIINIGPDQDYLSLNELISLLNKIMKKDIKPTYIPIRFQEVKEANCSADKARKLLNYKTLVSFEQALREMVAWVDSQGPQEFSYNQEMEIQNSKVPEAWRKKLF